jgi:DNA-directed RNA polymerase subunit RPC12/RpoP
VVRPGRRPMECDAMLTVHLSCPNCSRNLLCHRLIAPGERLRCPHCGGQFRAGIDDAPQSVAKPRRGHGILLAWLLFANLLLLAGGGIAIAVAVGNRRSESQLPSSEPSHAQLAAQNSELRTPMNLEDSDHPTAPPAPAAPADKPTPSPDPHPNLAVDPPKPPPLPAPPRREPERTNPAKEKPSEPEKLHAPAPRETPQVHWLPPSIQKRVDRSIDNGVEFLRRQQHADGSWGHQTGMAGKRFTPGITALSALTLLECGVPAKDAQVRLAAHYLRQRMPELTTTYSISLAILFFDRLGEAADAARIRTLSLRLIAGQKTSGGWDYYCPTLNEDEELGLLALLYKDRPTTPVDLFAVERSKNPALEGWPKREEAKRDLELYRPRPSKVPPLELFIAQDRSPQSANRHPPTTSPSDPEQQTESGKRKAESGKPEAESGERLPGDSRRLSKRALKAADKLPESLRRTPALHAAELLRDPPDLSEPRTDNSNTQFAILGLLTAENYDVPMERAMALLDWRFRNSLTLQGGWNYRPNWQTTPAMTAAALMGLALKHGLLLPNRRDRGRNVTVHDDEIIHRGFLTLTGMLENYYAGFVFNQVPLDKLDLYCLWTVERVAVLYNLRTMGSLEWYPAGVQLLLPLQREDGSWSPKGTTCLEESSVASSFALLFLKRSNLARDLTKRLNNE